MPDLEPPVIAGAGIACLDHIIVAPQIPWGDSARVTSYHQQGGGLVATAIVACARLGARCRLFSLLGDDQIGRQILDELLAEGVDCGGVGQVAGGESPFSFIHVDEHSGERTIFHRSARGLEWREAESSLEAIGECGALLVDDYYHDLALAASAYARQRRVPVVADMTPQARNEDLMHQVDVLIAPRHFARKLGKEDDLDGALDAIHAFGPTTAVITLGESGWVYSNATGKGAGSAFRVDVVDTTGAGDVFHGAFAYGLALGWETARCCEFASAVAAIKCTKPGGRTGLPSLPQTLDFLRSNTTVYEW